MPLASSEAANGLVSSEAANRLALAAASTPGG